MNSSWAFSNTKRWCRESATLNMPANLENSAVATDWKRSVFIPIPKKSNAKECSKYHTVALISHASKVILKILQARLQQYMNHELPGVQDGFRKGRGTRDQIATSIGSSKKQESSRKTSTSWLCQSLGLWGSQQIVENSERDGNTRPPYLPPEKSICWSRSNS